LRRFSVLEVWSMPDFRAYIREQLPPLKLSGAREAEIVDELAIEFEEQYERAIRCGLSPDEAWEEVKSRARRWDELAGELQSAVRDPQPEFPGPSAQSNAIVRFAGELRRDLRYAARHLSRSPVFAIMSVLMLALGIGANTAIFSLMNAILLRALPVSHPEQLFFFGKVQSEGNTSFLPHGSTEVFSYPFFREFRRRNQVFSEVAAIQSSFTKTHGRVAANRDLEQIDVDLVSGSYFHTLGVNTIVGRVFSDSDDATPGGHAVAIASYSWWQNRLAGARSLNDKTVTIGGTVYNIIGVAPPGFFGLTVGQSPSLWIPLAMQKQIDPDESALEENMFRFLHIIARVKPGVSRQQAQANTDLVFRQILRGYLGPRPLPQELSNIQHAFIELTGAATGRSQLRSLFTAPLQVLMTVVVLVLLIACANIANLLLARATARQQEIAIRLAVGAERKRLIRQLLAESALLGFVGAALGVAFAWGASQLLLVQISRGARQLAIHVTPDATVLGFTVAVTILTVLLFGTAPALRATGVDLARSLHAGRGASAGAIRNRLTRLLVVGQVAMSLMLLAGAGLFLRSLANLMNIDVGFDKQNVLRMMIDPSAAGYQPDERLTGLMQRIEERLDSLPGISAASFALSVFDGGGWSQTNVVAPGSQNYETENHVRVDLNVTGPRYFDVMRMPVVLGRALNERDKQTSRKVAVINQTMARTHFPGSSPLGRVFEIGEMDGSEWQNIEVVGVVKDAKYMEPEEKQMPAAFFPLAQHHAHFLYNLVVRYTGDASFVAPAVRKAISGLDPNLPVSDVRTLAEMVDDFTVNRRVIAQLSTFFGILAALLACIGIYGVMSYGVARRTNEFGIRMALGAGRNDVLWSVIRETLSLAVGGVAAGLILTLASGRFFQSLLFGIKAYDPMIISLAVPAMVVVAIVAGYLPARRATRIDPSVALRYQ
jgi:predicted permease